MPESMIIPVVLSGGAGTRLWPASRKLRPKQLLPLVGDTTMIHDTLARLEGVGRLGAPIVVTAQDLDLPVRRALRDAGIDEATVILEPMGRNTAPAVAVAAHEIVRSTGDALMLVLPADHVITDLDAFHEAVATAARAADDGRIVTFGITPTAPETGYGYIRAGDRIDEGTFTIDEFKEKPDVETARSYLADGSYAWNSGMFVFRAGRYLEELALHRPDIAAGAEAAYAAADRSDGTVALPTSEFGRCPAESIDFAVMEHTDRGAIVPSDPGWSDVGSWSSLWELGVKDADGNVLRGDVIAVGTEDSYVRASNRVIGVVGLEDVVVVDTPDALLVASRGEVQDVKEIVQALEDRRDPTTTVDRTVERPWGTERSIASGPGHRMAVATIDPTAAMRLDEGIHHLLVIDGEGGLGGATDTRRLVSGDSATVDGCAEVRADAGNQLRMLLISVDTVFDVDALRGHVERSE